MVYVQAERTSQRECQRQRAQSIIIQLDSDFAFRLYFLVLGLPTLQVLAQENSDSKYYACGYR
jgi:hypothetical protein